jgi:hypothetical protein
LVGLRRIPNRVAKRHSRLPFLPLNAAPLRREPLIHRHQTPHLFIRESNALARHLIQHLLKSPLELRAVCAPRPIVRQLLSPSDARIARHAGFGARTYLRPRRWRACKKCEA